MKNICLILILFWFAVSSVAKAEAPPQIPDVLFAKENAQPAKASLSDLDWIVGLWEGEVFGGIVEHRIMAAHKGHMPGIVRLRAAETDDVSMYELSSFIQTDETITYRIRHFGADLVAFQEPNDFIDRPLIKFEDGIAYFDGITFAPIDETQAVVTFILDNENGESTQHVVHYTRRG